MSRSAGRPARSPLVRRVSTPHPDVRRRRFARAGSEAASLRRGRRVALPEVPHARAARRRPRHGAHGRAGPGSAFCCGAAAAAEPSQSDWRAASGAATAAAEAMARGVRPRHGGCPRGPPRGRARAHRAKSRASHNAGPRSRPPRAARRPPSALAAVSTSSITRRTWLAGMARLSPSRVSACSHRERWPRLPRPRRQPAAPRRDADAPHRRSGGARAHPPRQRGRSAQPHSRLLCARSARGPRIRSAVFVLLPLRLARRRGDDHVASATTKPNGRARVRARRMAARASYADERSRPEPRPRAAGATSSTRS